MPLEKTKSKKIKKKLLFESIPNKESKIKNKGTGAGGQNTNKNAFHMKKKLN